MFQRVQSDLYLRLCKWFVRYDPSSEGSRCEGSFELEQISRQPKGQFHQRFKKLDRFWNTTTFFALIQNSLIFWVHMQWCVKVLPRLQYHRSNEYPATRTLGVGGRPPTFRKSLSGSPLPSRVPCSRVKSSLSHFWLLEVREGLKRRKRRINVCFSDAMQNRLWKKVSLSAFS